FLCHWIACSRKLSEFGVELHCLFAKAFGVGRFLLCVIPGSLASRLNFAFTKVRKWRRGTDRSKSRLPRRLSGLESKTKEPNGTPKAFGAEKAFNLDQQTL